MQKGGSGRLSITVGCVYDDVRIGMAALRVLGLLGTYADAKTGMCRPDRKRLAARLGISYQAVSRALRQLQACGYVEIIERYSDFNGARLASHYRLIMDAELPDQYRRAPVESDEDTPTPLSLSDTGVVSFSDTSPLSRNDPSPLHPVIDPPITERHPHLSLGDTSIKEERPSVNDPMGTSHTSSSSCAADAAPLAADAAAPKAAEADQAKILRGLSEDARTVLDYHRQQHGRRRPAKLTPAAAQTLEDAVADLGVKRLCESVKFMAGKIPPIPELSKAINAARTKRRMDEDGGRPKASAPYRNGTARPTVDPGQMNVKVF